MRAFRLGSWLQLSSGLCHVQRVVITTPTNSISNSSRGTGKRAKHHSFTQGAAPRTPASSNALNSSSTSHFLQETLGFEPARVAALMDTVQGRSSKPLKNGKEKVGVEAGLKVNSSKNGNLESSPQPALLNSQSSSKELAATILREVASPPHGKAAIDWSPIIKQLYVASEVNNSDEALLRLLEFSCRHVAFPTTADYDTVAAHPLYMYAVLARALLHRTANNVVDVASALLHAWPKVKGEVVTDTVPEVMSWQSSIVQSMARCYLQMQELDTTQQQQQQRGANDARKRQDKRVKDKTREELHMVVMALSDSMLCSVKEQKQAPQQLKWACAQSRSLLRDVFGVRGVDSRRSFLSTHQSQQQAREQWAFSLLMSHVAWMFSALDAFLHTVPQDSGPSATYHCSNKDSSRSQKDASLIVAEEAAQIIEALWQHTVQPLRVRSSADACVTHRTIHSALNLHLAHLQHGQRDRKQDIIVGAEAVFQAYWREQPHRAVMLLSAASALADTLTLATQGHTACQCLYVGIQSTTTASGVVTKVAAVQAILARTLLDVELSVTMQTALVLRDEWCVPVSLLGATDTETLGVGSPLDKDRETRTSTAAATTARAADDSSLDSDDADCTRKKGERKWVMIYQQADGVRARIAVFVSETFRSLVHLEMSSDKVADQHVRLYDMQSQRKPNKPPSRLFLSMIHTTFFPLMRRQYLMIHGGRRLAEEAFLQPLRFKVEESATLFASCLSTFVLLRETESPFDERAMTAGSSSSDSHTSTSTSSTFSVCGTTLAQSVEVAFFLTFYLATPSLSSLHVSSHGLHCRHHQALITLAAARVYTAEVLFALGHSTAKQLWFLRRRGTLFYFSGLRQDRTFIQDETVRRRHAQSILSVVHAHVVHPSLLWMPLWQVQELVFVLVRNSDLLYDQSSARRSEENSSSSSSGGGGGGADSREESHSAPSRENAHDSLAELLGVTEITSDSVVSDVERSAGRSPVKELRRTTVTVGATTTVDLARVHGYLVLRLFVISNGLREYGAVLRERGLLRGCSGEALNVEVKDADLVLRTPSDSSLSPLDKVGSYEPSTERAKRADRQWAREVALLLADSFPSAAADVEGVSAYLRGVLRSLSRLESTVRVALTHNLFFNVTREQRQKRRAVLEDLEPLPATVVVGSSGGAVPTIPHVKSGEGTDATHVQLEVSRESVQSVLGFVLDGSNAVVKRVELGTPFAVAAASVAFDQPEMSFVGWRVTAVDDTPVADGKAVIALIKGKLSFRLTLSS